MNLGEVDARSGELDAELNRMLSGSDRLDNAEQRLGRHASLMKADAAEGRPGIDYRRLHAQLGGTKRSRISRGSAADDDKLGFLRELADDHGAA
jgi:hypothetical protein